MSRGLDLFAGGALGAWTLRHAPVPLVRQVVCLDDDLIALAAEIGHEIYAGDPHSPGFRPGQAALAVHFPIILQTALIARYRGAIWSVHPGLLPWGRGTYPVFWALWERTPAGATLHELTAELSRGPVVEQRPVSVLQSDTGGRLHERVQEAERNLIARWLPRLASGERPRATPQPPGGTYHTIAEFEHLRNGGREEVPRADRERLNRALTFPSSAGPVAVPGVLEEPS